MQEVAGYKRLECLMMCFTTYYAQELLFNCCLIPSIIKSSVAKVHRASSGSKIVVVILPFLLSVLISHRLVISKPLDGFCVPPQLWLDAHSARSSEHVGKQPI